MRGFQPWDWGPWLWNRVSDLGIGLSRFRIGGLWSWNRVSCLRPHGYEKGATRLSSSLVAPLPASVCRPTAYFPNIFEKNPCFLTFSSRKDPSLFASACEAPPLPPLPPMRTISCRKGDFT